MTLFVGSAAAAPRPSSTRPAVHSSSYQLFMLALCVFSLGILAALTFVRLEADTVTILHWADLVVCGFFFIDFVHSLVTAPSRTRYFLTWGWIDLISSVPLIAALRIGRAARIIRVLQLLRAIRASRMLAEFLVERRAQSGALAAMLSIIIAVFFGSIAMLHFERRSPGLIDTPGDAVWWAVTTITTVGYGDMVPVTTGGKVVAGFLMIGGVALYGVVAGLVASWFLLPVEREEDREIAELRGEIQALRRDLAGVRVPATVASEPPSTA